MSNTSLESMLAALSPGEKLAALDMLWRDLSANPADLPSPDWHGDVLDARLADPSANPRFKIRCRSRQVECNHILVGVPGVHHPIDMDIRGLNRIRAEVFIPILLQPIERLVHLLEFEIF